MSAIVTDGELERIRDTLRVDVSDAKAAQAWAGQARKDLETLLELVDDQHRAEGGTFAVGLRQALEGKILQRLNQRAALTDDTRELSLLVSVTPGVGVVVDVRLALGVWKQ